MRLHHVQVSCPPGGESAARLFYTALGLTEVSKPEALAGRGGCWFRAYDGEVVVAELHVGVENDFLPARKAHPAFAVDSTVSLDATAERLRDAGFVVDDTERTTLAGYLRFHAHDPFANRVEVLAPLGP